MKKLCVIFGGASCEHDISIITGLQLSKNLAPKYDLEKIYLSLDNRFFLATKISSPAYFSDKEKINLKEIMISNGAIFLKGRFLKKYCDIDCVINCCHGGMGENGDLYGFFAVNNVRVTSTDTLSAHITMDKTLTKTLLKDTAPTISGVKITRENLTQSTKEVREKLSTDLIVKPNSLGSSIGVKICNRSDFCDQVEAIFEMHDDALVENRVVNLTEYNQACFCSSGELVTSAIERPLNKAGLLTFDDKYMTKSKDKGSGRELPAKISVDLETQITDLTKKIYKALNLSGVVRIDYIFDRDEGKLYFNEVNTIPGSMAYYLFEPLGIDYITLIEEIVANIPQNKKFSYFNSSVLSKNLI